MSNRSTSSTHGPNTQEDNNNTYTHVPVHVSVIRYLELVGMASLIWIMGNTNVPVVWLHVGAYVYVSMERALTQHRFSLSISQAMADDPAVPPQTNLTVKPSNSGDSLWINKLLEQMWPATSTTIENLIKDMEPMIKENFSQLNNFRFDKIYVDVIPARVQNVHVQPQCSAETVDIDLDLEYRPNCDISFRYKDLDTSITEFSISGPLRLLVRTGDKGWPFVSKVELSFLKKPDFDIVVSNCQCDSTEGRLFMQKEAVRRAISLEINALMLAPNQFPIYTVENREENTRPSYGEPQGIVRVTIEDVRNMPQAVGRRESDSFVITKVGSKAQKTRLDANSVDPESKQSYDFMVDSPQGQIVSLHVLDYFLNRVEKLGRAEVSLREVINTGAFDKWVSLQDVESGKVRLKCQWFWLSRNPIDLYLIETDASQQHKNTAVLVVYLDSAENIPTVVNGRTVSLKVMFKLGKQQEFSSVLSSDRQSKCKQAFRFMVSDAHNQSLEVNLVSESSDSHVMAEGALGVGEVLKSDKMEVDTKFKLQGGKQSVYLYMRLSLRILTTKRPVDML